MLEALGLPHHRVRDASFLRGSCRVRRHALRVARRLAHADVQIVAKASRRDAPTSDERDAWERAPVNSAPRVKPNVKNLKSPSNGTAVGTALQNESSQPQRSDWLDDSRGGTRTHDPGIMSAVL